MNRRSLLIRTGVIAGALGALILFATNLICINVAGILTFLFQGLAPRSWRVTAGTLMVWVLLLVALLALILPRFLP